MTRRPALPPLTLLGLLLAAPTVLAQGSAQDPLVAELRALDGDVFRTGSEERAGLLRQVRQDVYGARDEANRRSTADWQKIRGRADWEKLRDDRVRALRQSLGSFPAIPKPLRVQLTRKLQGDGYVIENLLYESRPGLWVTANLYLPEKPAREAPGILICHSHHNPKTQGELQDMGMTWARLGCLVLVPDLPGHGERRVHPFTDAGKYRGAFKPGRQDYYFRYNLGMQLHLIGDSLMGWMVWDLMRGVDLLLGRPGVAKDKIIVLGAVAGGGDPAAVTAALDERIAAVAPFNFGGPQPETRYPLSEDAETSFNYAGSGSWESTRDLRRSARDGFLPWVIVGAVAPRRLVYAHEFAWDRVRDPVWKRLQTVYAFYDTPDRLAFAHGRGKLTGQPPESTHCNNIGPEHRAHLHAALAKWFGIPTPAKEFQSRRPADELQCLPPDGMKLPDGQVFRPINEAAYELGKRRAERARANLSGLGERDRSERVRQDWKRLLAWEGHYRTPLFVAEKEHRKAKAYAVRKYVLSDPLAQNDRAAGVIPAPSVPVLLLVPPRQGAARAPVVVALAQSGKHGYLRHRAETIAGLLRGGVAVCLPDLRRTGESRIAGDGRGRSSASTAYSATELMLGRTALGGRLGELARVLDFLAKHEEIDAGRVALWGDSFAPVNPPDRVVAVPLDADRLPDQAEPLGGLLALFGALYHDEVKAVYARGGLGGYLSVLDGPFCYVPHDAIVPGALTAGDLADVAAVLAPRPLRLEGLVDGRNRVPPSEQLDVLYGSARAAYRGSGRADELVVRPETLDGPRLADWFVARLRRD